ncbi:cupin family protein [Reticulomyxa filosa]|uniref:Cupin family protein n=1 Tax=Reticulomyxa filosa TaxID=46433 RepID=X6PBW0_RETFI|nr:cupin family protein [Reticulomyxa filosa]|eukprot:ETO35157.1 cupin family protein [Reticulomyxa filosa]
MIRRKDGGKPFVSPENGEIVDELFGEVGKGTKQHSLALITIPHNKSSKLHYHPVAEESYYIMSGEGEIHYWHVNDLSQTHKVVDILKPGDAVAIPVMYWHQIFNKKKTDLQFLAVCVPSWHPQCSIFHEDLSKSKL